MADTVTDIVEPRIVHGDARALDLPDASVDLVACSPPYWSLRSYRDGGEHYDGQVGSEETPEAFVDALLDCTREMMRVLKPSGSIFVNLGDKYGPNKSLMLLPHRYATACADRLGLIVRQDQVWSKANGLPESVVDRTRRSHEYVFHLTKSPRYYAAVDEIREPHAQFLPNGKPSPRAKYGGLMPAEATGRQSSKIGNPGDDNRRADWVPRVNPLGKLPGSVWEIATQPLRVPAELGIDHFAAWPMEIPRRLILGWSPCEVCTACGEGRRPVRGGAWYFAEPANDQARRALARALELDITAAEVGDIYGIKAFGSTNRSDSEMYARGGALAERMGGSWSYTKELRSLVKRAPSGYACACPDTSAPSTPGVVLDPFGGTGTTALVAAMHGRQGISVDASHDYCRLAEWRVNDPKQRERAARAAGSKPAKHKPRPPAEVVALPTRPDPTEALQLFDPLDGTAS